MSPPKKISAHRPAEEQQHTLGEQQSQQQGAREFASVEELLRHDALQNPVPPSVERRLQESVARLPAPPARSWWRRLLGH